MNNFPFSPVTVDISYLIVIQDSTDDFTIPVIYRSLQQIIISKHI